METWKKERDAYYAELDKFRTTTLKVISCLAVISSGLSEINTNIQQTTLLLQDHVDFIKKTLDEKV
jgi:hypothetical protein